MSDWINDELPGFVDMSPAPPEQRSIFDRALDIIAVIPAAIALWVGLNVYIAATGQWPER